MDIKKFFGRKSPPEAQVEPSEEKLTREVSIHSNQRPTGKNFNKKLIYGFAVCIFITFTYALMFGIDSKPKAKEENENNQIVVKGDHLANVPKKYSDLPKEPTPKKATIKESTPRPNYTVPAPYAPVPSTPRMDDRNIGNISAVKPTLTNEEKIRQERLKEKLAANQSPIRFSISEEKEVKDEKTEEK